MQKGKVIMICGLPGAGKTTLAKKLEKEESAIRFCPDEWIPRLVDDPNNLGGQMKIRTPLEEILLDQAINIANHGVNVILENGFWTIKDRDKYKNELKKAGLKIDLYYLEVPINVLWERVEKRNQQEYPFKITREYLEKWYKVFQPVTEREAKDYDFYLKI